MMVFLLFSFNCEKNGDRNCILKYFSCTLKRFIRQRFRFFFFKWNARVWLICEKLAFGFILTCQWWYNDTIYFDFQKYCFIYKCKQFALSSRNRKCTLVFFRRKSENFLIIVSNLSDIRICGISFYFSCLCTKVRWML